MTIHARGAGVAILRDSRGRFVGRVRRIGSTGWQAWACRGRSAPLEFIGWGRTRGDAAALLEGRNPRGSRRVHA